MTLEDAIKHLTEYVDGLEVAANCENRIVRAYEPEMVRWSARFAGEPVDDHLNRMVRISVDAKSNAERITKDAAAIRLILKALEQKTELLAVQHRDSLTDW